MNLRCENVVEFLEIKTHENVQFPGVSPFQVTPPLASSKLPKMLVKSSYQFLAPAASASGNQILPVFLWICLSLQILGVMVCPASSFL